VLLAALWSCQSSNPPVALRPVKVGKLWGYADDSGAMRISPRFQYAHEFNEGRAMVEPEYGWGVRFIDTRGEIASGEQFLEWAGPFAEGVSPTRLAERRYWYLDPHGRWVREPQYFGARTFSEGLAAVQLTKEGAWGFIDRQFRLAIPARYSAVRDFRTGVAPAEQHGQWGFIDKTGAWAIAPRFADARMFSAGAVSLAPVRTATLFGYIESGGKLAWPAEYEEAWQFEENFASVRVGGKWGMIDARGHWVVTPQFDDLYPLERGWAPARIGERYGYVNAQGERRHWPPQD